MIRRVQCLGYELCLKLGLARYRRPYAHDVRTWDDGYARGEHDHYADVQECARYGALAAYVRAKGAPLAILDVGCGTGVLRSHLDDRQIERFVGTDISDVAVRTATDRRHSRSEFHVCSVPGGDLGPFDVIICNEMLYYVPDLGRFLSHLRSMLKCDGWLVTSITRHPGDFTLHEQLAERFERLDEVTVKSATIKAKWRIACYAKGLALAAASWIGDIAPSAAPLAAAF